ncbi:MAG: flagellar biosynthesis protein FlhF [Clostridia bacterium]|nr:flagellar biosynthesis protein FlhF [Clostridia bacterium]
MKIRRYLGNNTQEAILKVKMDLGNEAIILNTRKVRKKGILNIFSKPMIEVLAAIDEDYGKKESLQKDAAAGRSAPKNAGEIQKPVVTNVLTEKAEEKNNFDKKEEKISELENKVNSMESLLKKIYEQMQPMAQKAEKQQDVEEKKPSMPNVLQLFYNNLVKNEVDAEHAKKFINIVKEKVGSNASVNETASLLFNIISGALGKPDTIKLREDGKPTIVIFVGPTGVGKTTTLAKIAANYSLNQKKEVGLITADTYRIAAVEQLKTYAEILGMPATVIYSINEISDAISAFSNKDIILIDTAGRSHRNKSQFEELKTLVAASEANEIYLVLSATTSNSNCKEIINNYSFLKDYKLIFTKLDEAPVAGVILNSKLWTNKELSYVTTGQSVPDDIEVANTEKITKLLLGSIS